MLLEWAVQEPVGLEDDVVPERLPLVLLVPGVGALEERDDQPLRLHEDHLRGANLDGGQIVFEVLTASAASRFRRLHVDGLRRP